MKNEKDHLFDDPKNVKRVLYILYGCCALLLILDFVIHRHVMHSWENLWGFYPLYGFVGCVILVLVATWMRTFLIRDEDYYDKTDMNNSDQTDTEKLTNKRTSETGVHHVDD
tara:strand:- start:128397 stop:128732 length:336 start_codon:yes stop_codon:yes gene_type:complete